MIGIGLMRHHELDAAHPDVQNQLAHASFPRDVPVRLACQMPSEFRRHPARRKQRAKETVRSAPEYPESERSEEQSDDEQRREHHQRDQPHVDDEGG
ncbi:MAG: hypothetical protein IPP94_18525 [Ignavibacteria bacterium]|nr:hypothetical protein [Ignavibacteria bacterium]